MKLSQMFAEQVEIDPRRSWEILLGDCLSKLAEMPANSIDAVVTDPPYGLEFMGKDWDAPWKQTSGGFSAPGIGARAVAWPSYKGSNRSRCSVCKMLIGQGGSPCKCEQPQPVLQDADRMRVFQVWCEQWAREILRVLKPGGHMLAFGGTRTYHRMVCAIEDAGFEIRDSLHWFYGSGFPKSLNLPVGVGTALKPAHEPVVLARKPLDGTVAANVMKHGTGGLNIDATRIGPRDRTEYGLLKSKRTHGAVYGKPSSAADFDSSKGRWPANILLDEDAAAELDAQSGITKSGVSKKYHEAYAGDSITKMLRGVSHPGNQHGDSGGASRFFYVAKASRKEREEGLEIKNDHPTVKPIALMKYLVKLITPPGGLVLDPFCGSGTTGIAAVTQGFNFKGIELSPEYITIAEARIKYWSTKGEP